jgi:ubiquinone/menaquinone biosynthesis C-methylase UbiE
MKKSTIALLRDFEGFDNIKDIVEEKECVISCTFNNSLLKIKNSILYNTFLKDCSPGEELNYFNLTEDEYKNKITGSTTPEFIANMPKSIMKSKPHVNKLLTDFNEILDHVSFNSDDYVLDIGTATCWTTRELAKKAKNVVALDITDHPSFGLIAGKVQMDKHNCYFDLVLSGMEHTPFKDKTFSKIFFVASFHHTLSTETSIRELARIIKPKGKVYMVGESFKKLFFHKPRQRKSEVQSGHRDLNIRILDKIAKNYDFNIYYQLPNSTAAKIKKMLPSFLAIPLTFMLKLLPFQYQIASSIILTKK